MTVAKRFLVLDRTNTAQRPCDHGVHLPDLQGEKSPSFTKEESARAFADLLAQKNVGQKYYLAEIKAGVVEYSTPVEPGNWVDAAADSAE